MNIEQMARDYGLTDSYLDKLNLSNKYIEDGSLKESDIINSQLNQQIGDYNLYKDKADKEAIKEGQNAYVDYAKGINPYGQQAENQFKMGLGGSGMTESSLIGANNSYQNRVTDVVTNKNNIFADVDNNIAKARETGNIELAKISKNKMDKMLENLWRIKDEKVADEQKIEEQRRYEEQLRQAELQRAEEQRRYERELALSRQKNTSIRKGSSGSGNNNNKPDFNDDKIFKNGDPKAEPYAWALSENTIAITQPDGSVATMQRTRDDKDDYILEWGKKHGVNLSGYIN